MIETDFLVGNFLPVPNTFISGKWIQNSWLPVWKLHWSQWPLAQLWKIWEQILRISVTGTWASTVRVWRTTARSTCGRAPTHGHRPVVFVLLQCFQRRQRDTGLWKWIAIWARDLRGRSQIDTVGDYGSHLLIRWYGSGWEISCWGGASPCFPLSTLPCSTSAHDCGVNVSLRRYIKIYNEYLGKILTLFSE